MASFRDIQEMVLVSHASGFITYLEFLLLCEENMSDNLDFPYKEYLRICWQNGNEAECKAKFRVKKHHIAYVKIHYKFLVCLNVIKERYAMYPRPLHPP